MASEIRVDKINSLSGVGTVTLSPTGVDISGITTVSTLKVGTGVTASSDGDIFFTGIATATTFSGSGANLTALPSAQLSGALPAISAASLTNVPAANVVGVHTSLTVTNATTTGTAVVGGGVTISESGIEASGIGITCANLNGGQIGGRRNLIINGAMQVAQRGTSSTSSGYHTIDRWSVNHSVQNAPTSAQAAVASGTTPYSLGFRKELKVTNGDQSNGATASSILYIRQFIEAQDMAQSGWNYTSSSSFITLSFWIKSSVAQSFHGHLRTRDGTAQRFPFQTGSLTQNQWTKITKKIPGNSNLQFDTDTDANSIDRGLDVVIIPYMGTTYSDPSATFDQWQESSDGNFAGTDMTTTWFTTNDATLEITGVQLEIGSQATAFEHHNFGEELSLCHRYCQVYPKSTGDKYGTIFNANVGNSGWVQGAFTFPEMRSSPTATNSGNFRILVRNNAVSISSFNYYHASKNSLNPQALTSSTLTVGDGAMVTADNDASAKITLSSEL